jgi:hypothetical protein
MVTQKSVYQIKVTLEGLRPPVWRRIVVPKEYTFWELNVALLSVMGWDNSHLHHFFVKKGRKVPTYIRNKWQGDFDDGEYLNEKKTKIDSFLKDPSDELFYEYDMGDSWLHKIKLEKILPADPTVKYPICTDGKRACPPDDCGGVSGYFEMLEALEYSDHPEHETALEWLGEDYDPEHFNPEDVVFLNAKTTVSD